MRNKLHDLIFDGMVKYVEAGELSVHVDAEAFADFLISHGVTFAKDNNVPCKKPVLYSVTRGALCPKCDGELDFKIVQGGAFKQKTTIIRRKVAFCHLCGQALDWGEEPTKEVE